MIFLVMTAAVGSAMRDVLGAGAERFQRAPHRFGDRFEVRDVAVDHRVLGQRLDGVALDALRALAGVGQLDHLDGGGTDVHAEQRRRFGLENIELQLRIPARNRISLEPSV